MLDEQRSSSIEPIGSELKKLYGKIENLEKSLAELMSRNSDELIRHSNAIMQDTIISSVKAIVKEEMHLAIRDQSDRYSFFLNKVFKSKSNLSPVKK